MTLYHFVDGPLAGQSLSSYDPHIEGEVLTIEVVDVLDDPDRPLLEYYVAQVPGEHGPGQLRHTSAA